jgi:hypothetical protein
MLASGLCPDPSVTLSPLLPLKQMEERVPRPRGHQRLSDCRGCAWAFPEWTLSPETRPGSVVSQEGVFKHVPKNFWLVWEVTGHALRRSRSLDWG